MIHRKAEIEAAFQTLQDIHKKTLEIREAMKPLFQYSPFDYLPGKIKTELQSIRETLIKQIAKRLNSQYMPNWTPEYDFIKLMDNEAGEGAFKVSVLEAWFLAKTQNKQALADFSYEQILIGARYFVPHHHNDQPYGLPRNPRILLDKNVLILRAWTWQGKSAYIPASLSYSLNDRGQYNALGRLINILTQQKDPVTVKGEFFAEHLSKHRKDPENFYGKHQLKHSAIEAFQFFKNNKFKIWFRRAADAEKVAFALCGQTTKQQELGSLDLA